ncbi:MAG: formate dehydrogenase-N subunit alpha [Chloroflexi bacterium RBG_13_56_8]|nr:MAG: formate dehydrogenase-N subunit alpha [Chloroflexi bacterium RBG_13_56_8]
MTNHWVDLKNADYILIIGSNAAENHPASMTWIHKAMDERGAKLIVVDPRFTRTASQADIYAPIRSGTDIAFFGGLMKYIMDNELYHREYLASYTNAATLISPDFKGPADLDGLFSGYNPETHAYDRGSWSYQTGSEGEPQRDETLQAPNSVFQIARRHYARYDLDTVSEITGCPKDKLELVYKTYAESGAPEKTGTILYAMGQTQHTVGSQNVRCMAMIQLLLGNIGRPGGGVNALRGESNVQGSTDMALLADTIPAYMATPIAGKHPTFQTYLEVETPKTSYWTNKPKFLVSLLKAWWGEHATAANGFAYDYMPKVDGASNHYWMALFESMYAGTIKGCWIMGQNPALSGPNVRFEREALKKLDWMVVQEIVETETVGFWKAPGENPADIQTEVFVLPAADAMEKEGSIVTSGRLIQWRPKVANPSGQALADDQILNLIGRELQELYAAEPGDFADPILHLTWDYGAQMDIEKVAAEINGYYTTDNDEGKKGDVLVNFSKLKDDGTTACGNWLFSGYWYPVSDGEGNILPATKRRGQKDPGGLGMYPYWAFSWPVNRRIIYNRCSADLNGNPWAEDKALIWWNGEKWTGYDVPDFVATKAPDAPGGRDPFIMKPDGKGWIFGALNEGPLPEHYEPLETPVSTNAFSSQMHNPVIKIWKTNEGQDIGDNIGSPDKFPIVATTYRVCEHWQAGGMSRWLEWLTECQPEMFVELSNELAAEKGIENGEMVKVRSARGEIEGVAIVTARFRPFHVNGKVVHQIGLPWHFGWGGLATGDSANELTPHVGDGNTTIPEYKAFLVDVEKA